MQFNFINRLVIAESKYDDLKTKLKNIENRLASLLLISLKRLLIFINRYFINFSLLAGFYNSTAGLIEFSACYL